VCRFLLVALNIDAVLGEVTIRQRRKKLEEMVQGNGLSDAYAATLTRVKAQKGNKSVLGLKVLMWVLYSERPLHAQELCHALGVEIGSSDFDPENVPSLRTLLGSCLGLVTIEASSSTVRLVHFTLQEHLLSNPALFLNPHSTISEICLTYLNYRSICDLSPTLYSAPLSMPLLKYASCYWGEHARMGVTENGKMLALRLLDRFDKHISAQLLLLHCENEPWDLYFNEEKGPVGFTGLHGVSFLGIVEMVSSVLEMRDWDLNESDCMGCTALIWAAIKGYEEVVKILLEREDINPNQAGTDYGRTPLAWAAERGHEGVVRILLEREGVDPNQVDINYGQTPLLWAANNGHEGVVRILLEREDVNPNQADPRGLTPLWWAALSKHEGTVRMLLEREDINPNQADTECGQTPLSWAAEKGHEGVVRILLEREGVDLNQVDKRGRAPLSWAAENGHEGAVGILLEREGVDPNQVDIKCGRTPLLWAAENGHEGVVRILLERGDLNLNQTDIKYGRTPLLWATKEGHEGVVKMLLERGDVNPNQADPRGLTPLWWAALSKHGGTVRMLLEREDINPSQADTECGQTLLLRAAENGHEGLVRILLERGDLNLNQTDIKYDRTPLLWATKEGHEGVVKMLLERGDVNPNQADPRGLTPLVGCSKQARGDIKDAFGTRGHQSQPGRHRIRPNATLVGGWAWACLGSQDSFRTARRQHHRTRSRKPNPTIASPLSGI